MFQYSPDDDGVEADIFCHLIDVWVESEMTRSSDAKVDKGIDSLKGFRQEQGDRFPNADALAKAIDAWSAGAGTRGRDGTARRVLADLLGMWRSIEEPDADGEE